MMVERLLSFWEGNFSGAMLNFGAGIPDISLVPKKNKQGREIQIIQAYTPWN